MISSHLLFLQFGLKPTITVYPFFIHAFFMSIFASVIGPFGGFFASGFKRAFKIKVVISLPALGISFGMCVLCVSGLWRYHPGPRRNHGPIRLSVSHGHLRQRLHPQLHSNGFASKTASAGRTAKSVPKMTGYFTRNFLGVYAEARRSTSVIPKPPRVIAPARNSYGSSSSRIFDKHMSKRKLTEDTFS